MGEGSEVPESATEEIKKEPRQPELTGQDHRTSADSPVSIKPSVAEQAMVAEALGTIHKETVQLRQNGQDRKRLVQKDPTEHFIESGKPKITLGKVLKVLLGIVGLVGMLIAGRSIKPPQRIPEH